MHVGSDPSALSVAQFSEHQAPSYSITARLHLALVAFKALLAAANEV
jgi:hypothetical protein